MKRLPHVFSDASCLPNKTRLAVYSKDLNLSYKVTLNYKIDVYKAELAALKLAKKLTKDIQCHYFVDNQTLAIKHSVNWLPREYNKQADSLTKQSEGTPLGAISIANYIQQTYPLSTKLKLIAAIRGIAPSIDTIVRDKIGLQLLKSLLTKDERPANYKKLIANALDIKQAKLLLLIRTYQNGSLAKV